MGDQVDTVWVLGAGFSRPLGGPLLPQLFTKASRDTAWLRFPKEKFPQLHDDVTRAAHWLYHCGRKFPDGFLFNGDEVCGDNLWSDAEEFLDKLDAASQQGVESANWQRLSRAIRR